MKAGTISYLNRQNTWDSKSSLTVHSESHSHISIPIAVSLLSAGDNHSYVVNNRLAHVLQREGATSTISVDVEAYLPVVLVEAY
jgi:hypothetical protein